MGRLLDYPKVSVIFNQFDEKIYVIGREKPSCNRAM